VLPFALLGAVEPAALGVSVTLVGVFITRGWWRTRFGARRGLRGISAELPKWPGCRKIARRNWRCAFVTRRKARVSCAWGWRCRRDCIGGGNFDGSALPAGSEWSHVSWSCTPRKRGNYQLDAVYLEGNSPLGFWAGRKQVTAKSEISRLSKPVDGTKKPGCVVHEPWFVWHPRATAAWQGPRLRETSRYVPATVLMKVHWKATARRGKPITKVFQVERTQEVYV